MSSKSEINYLTPIGKVNSYIDCNGQLEITSALERFAPILPSHMKIEESRIFKWNIKAIENYASFKAICKLEPNCNIDGGHESGQYLEAYGWQNREYILSLGTDDSEYLNFSATKGVIPKRFATNNILESFNWVKYVDNGLIVEVPALLQHEHIELYFAIAWKHKDSDEDDISTWYTIGLALDYIHLN
jgi:hypothetical protein